MYAATKMACEHMCEAYFNSYNYLDSCIILRLIHSYGKYCQSDRFPSLVKQKFQNEKCPHFILKTKNRKRWISIDDLCKKVDILLNNFNGYSVFNLVGDESITLEEFISKFGNTYTYEYDTRILINGYTNESNANGDKLSNFINSISTG
jgi:nucleoside-diphosphate-sugar epimerase